MLAKLTHLSLFRRLIYSCSNAKTVGEVVPRGKLLIVPTPIGNLRDLSPNMMRALFSADLIGCEDRRVAGQLYHLIRSRNLLAEMEESFGSVGLTSLVPVQEGDEVEGQKAHQFYNYANMKDKERRKFLRKMTEQEQTAFKVEFLKYRALKVLKRENEWGYSSSPDRLDELYGIDFSDMKHIETQILNCRQKKGRGLLLPLNTYNETKMFDLVRALVETKRVALVSDAGMPCISDPGWKLVDKLRTSMPNLPIQVIGGPSSVAILTLQASRCSRGQSLSGRFEGFSSLATGSFEEKNRQIQQTKMKEFSINFINANKLKGRLLQLEKSFGGDLRILLNNQLTKKYERRFQGTVAELLGKIDDPEFKPIGEISYLLYPSEEQLQIMQSNISQKLPQQKSDEKVAQGIPISPEKIEELLYSSVTLDVTEFLQTLDRHQVKMPAKQKRNLLCAIFGLKTGEARKYVYDKFSKDQQ